MLKIFIFATTIVASSLGSSCNSRSSEKTNSQERLSVKTPKPPLDCLEGRDTIFPNKDYLRFVTIGDTVFDLKVGMDGNAGLLGFRFNCKIQSGLIPNVLKHTGNQLILVRGYGFHYREVIICSVNGRVLNVQRFETELAIGAKYNAVVYPDSKDSSKIIVSDLLTGRQIVLQMRKNVNSIKLFQITESAVVVVGMDGQETVMPFSR